MLDEILSLNALWWICAAIWFPACIGLVLIVLMQKGKGAGFAGAFGGGGGSETVFGPRARRSLPVRLTYIMAGTFMVLSLFLSLIVGRISDGIAPGTVDESVAEVANSNSLDSLFGEEKQAEAPDPAVTPIPIGDAGAAAASPEGSVAPAESSPAPASIPAPEPAGQ